jgi:hypothetical protein
MESINNIVLVQDAEKRTDDALNYALQLSNHLNARLTIGLCYQAAEPMLEGATTVSNAFQHIKKDYLVNAPVDYRLVSCNTQRCEDADTTLSIYLPDLYVLNLKAVDQLYPLLDRIYCPILLLQTKMKFKPVQKILMLAENAEETTVVNHAAEFSGIINADHTIIDMQEEALENALEPSSHKAADKTDYQMLVLMVNDKLFSVMQSFYRPIIDQALQYHLPVVIYKI